MIDVFTKEIKGLPFSWPEWYVYAKGSHDLTTIRYDWSLQDLFDAYYHLRIRALLGGE